MQGCRIGAMTPFTAPGNAIGHRFSPGATIITCIIIQGVKLVVGTELLAPAKLIFNTPGMGVVIRRWVWLESIGVVSGCFPHITYISLLHLYLLFFSAASLLFFSFC